MAASKTAICQRALARLGCTTNISNVDTDTAQEAKLCRIFYSDCLKNTLESCDWPFAKKINQSIALISTNNTGDWLSRYAYPNDAIRILGVYPVDGSNALPYPQSIYSYISNYKNDFEIINGANGKEIATFYNVALSCDYIVFEENTLKYPASFEDALVYRLAAELALGLAKSESIAAKMMNAYTSIVAVAKASQKNENRVNKEARIITSRML